MRGEQNGYRLESKMGENVEQKKKSNIGRKKSKFDQCLVRTPMMISKL